MQDPHAAPPSAGAATDWIASVVGRLEPLQLEFNVAQWDASITGSEADAARRARYDTAVRELLSDPATYAGVRACRAAGGSGESLDRQLEVLERLLAAHQMPRATIEQIVALETQLDTTFNNFRATVGSESMTDNALRQVLRTSIDESRRREVWEAAKQVGAEVEPRLLELVRLRNRAARALGYRDYYAMMLELDELDEGELFVLLDRVEAGTRERFRAYREALDTRLGALLGVTPERVRPWHMIDPFFQEAPPAAVDLDRYFVGRDTGAVAARFFAGIGLDVAELMRRADLYEKPGKSQHAFCLAIDRGDDVRVLCNLQPNEFWMSVLLHELGHGVYDLAIDPGLPWLLRTPAHTLTTEASAMLFGRLSRNGAWLRRWVDLEAGEAERLGRELARAAREQLLVTTRWCLVMCHMERALYADPEQDLPARWWGLVERLQLLQRPEGRRGPDWASKIHFSVAPVYYHNYLLGEILASQLQRTLLEQVGGGGAEAWDRVVSHPETGALLRDRLFRPGKSLDWRALIRRATGTPLAADAFVAELCSD